MCSEIDRFSPFWRMSGDKILNLTIPVGEDEAEIDQSSEIGQVEERGIQNEAAVSTKSESEKKSVEDAGAGEGEGFTTPTSSDHKIPPVMDCPPAPKKTRPQSSKLKRKASSSSPPGGARRRIAESEASTEVESIFRPVSSPDSVEEEEEPKLKKPRTDGQD